MHSTLTGTSVSSSNVGAAFSAKHPASPTEHPKQYVPIWANTTIVLNALLDGERLEVRRTAKERGILYLTQIVRELRKRGILVKTDLISVIRSDGRTAHYAQYFMVPDDIAAFKGAKK